MGSHPRVCSDPSTSGLTGEARVIGTMVRSMENEQELWGTPDVADDEDVEVEVARAWAAANDVQMVGNSYVWTEADREAFGDNLDADEEEEEDEDDEESEDEDAD